MKKALKFLALTALMPVAVLAQGSLDEEVNAELDRMYGQQNMGTAAKEQPTVHVTVSQSGSASQQASVPTTVVAPVTQQSALQAVQKQPTTIIEAAPLAESGAEKLRRSRQDAELSTEQTIVEKLEQSRLEDEKRRAQVLFGDKFQSLSQQEQAAAAVAVPVGPVTVPAMAAPAVVVVDEAEKRNKELDRELIQGEVSAALAELKNNEEEKSEPASYFAVLAGAGDYPSASNVRGNYSLGAAYGRKFDDRLVVEGSLLYSSYEVRQRDGREIRDMWGVVQSYPRITEMNQYSTSALVKYQLMGGMIRPEVGALLSYSYRTYSDIQMALSSNSASTHALDMGLMTGASLELSQSFSMGLDFRYMFNLTSRVDGTVLRTLTPDKPIERFNYYTIMLVGRTSF